MRIDLHMHSTASDGTDEPAALAEKARALGLDAIALTDHDTVDGVAQARAAGERLGVEVVAGIEVSSDYRDNNVHLLGYFIDPASPALAPVLDWVRAEREERNRKMVAMLAADGFDISMEALEQAYPGAVIGRPHVAEWLTRKGYVSSVTDGFQRYLEVGRPYYLPKRRIPLRRAVETVRAAGGIASLAHPFQYGYPEDEVAAMIETAADCGAEALECYYTEHTPAQTQWLLKKAAAMGLAVTGGSDYHGTRKPWISMGSGAGDLAVPGELLAALKARAGK